MVARIATASVISSSVNPPCKSAGRRFFRSTRAIHIKLDLPRLRGPVAFPLRREGNKIDPVQLSAVRFGQTGGRGFLDQFHRTITSVDLEFLRRIGNADAGLNLRHSIRQNLTDTIFLRAERARIQTILGGTPERDDADRENRNADEHFVKRESASRWSIGVTECWSNEILTTPLLHYSTTRLFLISPHI